MAIRFPVDRTRDIERVERRLGEFELLVKGQQETIRLLASKLVERDAEIVTLKAENTALRADNARLRSELERARALSTNAPTVPSGQIPPYQKASTPARKRKGRPGARAGHAGVNRKTPEHIDRTELHEAHECPHCHGPVAQLKDDAHQPVRRSRIVEDVVPGKPEVVEHQIGVAYCSNCKMKVEPCVTAALPGARLGLRLVVMTAMQHFVMGISISKIAEMLASEHGMRISDGALVDGWHRLARLLTEDYERLGDMVRDAGVLHADETGWRVNGKSHWLWCFCNKVIAFYVIDRSRGSDIAVDVLGEFFGGTLIADFYAAYKIANSARMQRCLAHLLREFKKIRANAADRVSDEFAAFERRTKRLIGDAIRFAAKEGLDPPSRKEMRLHFEARLDKLLDEDFETQHVRRLAQRLRKHRDSIFVFVEDPEVSPTNNWAELQIRFAVLMRKTSYGNQSDRGAETQEVLMSLMRTAKLRGHDVIDEIMKLAQQRIEDLHRANYAARASHG